MNRIIGIHAVQALLDAGRAIDRVLIAKGATGQRLQKIIEDCRTRAISVRFEPRENLDRIADRGVHQGVVAYAAKKSAARVEDLIELAEDDGVLLVADSVQDPHNLGAVCRVAESAGAAGVVIPERRSAEITPAACKASAGAVEHLSIARVGNLANWLAAAKEKDAWIYGAAPGAEAVPYDSPDYRGRVVLVLGSEGRGIRPRVAAACDLRVALPQGGRLE